MANFALDVNTSEQELISSMNYLLSTVGSTQPNLLVSNANNGTITNISNGNVIGYLYQYLNIRYADSADGALNFSTSPTNRLYYGIRNTTTATASSNPADYIFYEVASGGFGTTKFLFYSSIGGNQIQWFVGTAAPSNLFQQVLDNTAIDLFVLTTAIPITTLNVFYPDSQFIIKGNANTYTPAAVANVVTITANVQAVRQSNITAAVDQQVQYFTANGNFFSTSNNSTAFNANAFSFGAAYSTAYSFYQPVTYTDSSTTLGSYITTALIVNDLQGNVGPAGQRGTVPLGFVQTVNNPILATSANLTAQFEAARTNTVSPIGLGIGPPVLGDTVQFFYPDTNLLDGGITYVATYDGANWTPVTSKVISGNVIYTGTITANAMSTNDVFTLRLRSTNATFGNIDSNGFWADSATGDARFAGTMSIGNNASIGNNLTVGNNAVIGNDLSVGNNTTIGANLTVSGLINGGALDNNTVTTNTIVENAVSETLNLITTQGTSQVSFLANSLARGFWPANTRGAVLASSIRSSDGGALGGNVQINYSATVYSDANTEYNCVEIWKWNPYYGNTFVNVDRVIKRVANSTTAGTQFWAAGAYGTVLACNNHSTLTPFANVSTFAYDVANSFNTIMSNGKVISNTYRPGMQVYDTTKGVSSVSGSLNGNYLVGSGGAIFKPDAGSNFFTGNTIQYYQGSGNWMNNSDIYAIWDGGYGGSGTTWPQWIVGQNALIGYRAFGGETFAPVTPTVGAKSWITLNLNNSVINGVNLNDIEAFYSNLSSPATNYTGMTIVGDNATILRANTLGVYQMTAPISANVNLRGVTWDSTNGRLLAVGDSGTIIYSSDLGITWANIASPTTRDLKSIDYNKAINKWAVVGDGISFLGTGITANSQQVQFWGNTITNSVTRLNFHGSFPYIGTTSLPPAQQRINNATISGSIIDVVPANEASNSYNYWLVVGNLSGNANVFVSAPTLNINWLKR
jgi:hypothetical protein